MLYPNIQLAILPIPSSLAADGYLTDEAAIITTRDVPELFVPDDGPTQRRGTVAAMPAGRYPVRIKGFEVQRYRNVR
ncbi:MAG: hypothetical protein KDJ54_05185 [Candidatus Competibacteraceae bacterium]|nr:hypothetical protein [Candidatus Competibacteraceae bacterium]